MLRWLSSLALGVGALVVACSSSTSSASAPDAGADADGPPAPDVDSGLEKPDALPPNPLPECPQDPREGVEQELWGVLLAYNLVRLEMERVAESAKVEPTRISFVESLRLIRDEWLWPSVTSPGAIPKRLATMRANMKRYILPPRRPRRSYPRAVKIKMSGYDRKRPRIEKCTRRAT